MQARSVGVQQDELFTQQRAARLKSRLEIADSILWQKVPEGSERGAADGDTGVGSPLAQQAFHAAVAMAMRCLVLHVRSSRLLCFQDTVPGPWQPAPGVLSLEPTVACF